MGTSIQNIGKSSINWGVLTRNHQTPMNPMDPCPDAQRIVLQFNDEFLAAPVGTYGMKYINIYIIIYTTNNII
jgi:hypothetical protein